MENNTNNNEERAVDIEKALENIENELKETDRILREDKEVNESEITEIKESDKIKEVEDSEKGILDEVDAPEIVEDGVDAPEIVEDGVDAPEIVEDGETDASEIVEDEELNTEVESDKLEENLSEEVNEKENASESSEIDIGNIKIEEIDLEQIKRELEAHNYSEERIEEELALLEKNILKQSDIFETELLLDAIIRDQELLDGINNQTGQEVKSVTGIIPTVDNNRIMVTNGTKVRKKTYNKAMSKVLVAVTVVFFSLILYIGYYVMFDSKDKLNNEYNERSLLLEETVVRGKILSSDQKILAQTIKEGEEWIRYYPYGSLFAHSVGRYSKGKTGIELCNDFTLVTTKDTTIDKIINDVNNEKSLGNNIVTTLDYNLQKVASDALGTRKGAVVAIEPSTGKILSMVSKPSYDPNYIEKNWSVLSNADNSKNSLLNRATMGQYSPGSTFKIVTALSYMRHKNADEYSYVCSGVDNFNGYNMSCYNNKRHRNQNLTDAFANSCNGAFATMGIELGKASLMKTANDLLFNTVIDYEYGYTKSSFVLNSNDDETMVAQTSIGQGNTQITPFHNALIVSAIANNGVLMKPYMVDKITDGDESVIAMTQPTKEKTLLTTPEVKYITNMMLEVVNSGTAMDLKNNVYSVAGKTGSAEYGVNGKSHAWFIGFAKAQEKNVAVSIIVEDGGTGTTTAVPIAKAIFENYF